MHSSARVCNVISLLGVFTLSTVSTNAENFDRAINATTCDHRFVRVALDNIHSLAVSFQDVDYFHGLPVPDEEVPIIGATHNVLVVQTVVIDVFDCATIAMTLVNIGVRGKWYI